MDRHADSFSDSCPDEWAQQASRRATAEEVLRAHPGVQEAAVIRDSGNNLVAFVVPDNDYVNEVLGRRAAGLTVVGKWRKIFDLSQFSKRATSASVGFNTMGWDSSYTRGAIPAGEMHEWVENTVGDILRLKPRTVCEIGCGTGMLVLGVAPHCERYVAVDYSPAVLGRLKEQLRTVPEVAKRVEVVERQAANLDDFSENTFDTVVLSSVVQFFPSMDYLTKVLEIAVSIVRPGGYVYVGDVRSLPLLQAFASSVELFQAADELSVGELRDRIRRRVEREPELALSPAYFLSLRNTNPKISRVDIRPLRGRADNEMTRFRYEAILHIGHDGAAVFDGEFLDWTEHRWGLDEIRSILRQHANQPIGIRGIGNGRIEKDLAAMQILDVADAGYSAGALRQKIEEKLDEGIHPQGLFDLENEDLGFAVFLSWMACRHDGSYDAFFIPKESLRGMALPAIGWSEPDASEVANLANAPGQGKFRNELIRQLVAHCRQNLPEALAPDEIALVDMLPRAADGEVAEQDLLKARLT
ncbi:MAG TPA: methyltransferase [Terracidiphilus sp.]|jgi:SAM-dependent methyltransferase|nr:methyltransferase [Terracidiphilus sp.]